MIIRTTQLTIAPEGEPIFSEMAFTVSIDDESGGEFVVIRSNEVRSDSSAVSINSSEWPALREAIDRMVGECVTES